MSVLTIDTLGGCCWAFGVPRKLLIQYPGAIYHVTSRGDQRQAIFRDEEDRQEFGDANQLRSRPEGVALNQIGNRERPIRIQYYGGGVSHDGRGSHGHEVFHDDRDRQRFLEMPGEGCEKTGFHGNGRRTARRPTFWGGRQTGFDAFDHNPVRAFLPILDQTGAMGKV